MTIPVLQSERLRLRPFDRADAVDVFAYAANPNVSRYTSWETHRTVQDSHAFIDMVLSRGPNEMTWAICRRQQPSVIGAIEFGPCDAAEAEVHYVLAEPFWNQGMMTEAVRTVLNWAFENCPSVSAVVSRAVTQNVGSLRVMEKCGLTFERVQMYRWSKCNDPVEQRQHRMVRRDQRECEGND